METPLPEAKLPEPPPSPQQNPEEMLVQLVINKSFLYIRGNLPYNFDFPEQLETNIKGDMLKWSDQAAKVLNEIEKVSCSCVVTITLKDMINDLKLRLTDYSNQLQILLLAHELKEQEQAEKIAKTRIEEHFARYLASKKKRAFAILKSHSDSTEEMDSDSESDQEAPKRQKRSGNEQINVSK